MPLSAPFAGDRPTAPRSRSVSRGAAVPTSSFSLQTIVMIVWIFTGTPRSPGKGMYVHLPSMYPLTRAAFGPDPLCWSLYVRACHLPAAAWNNIFRCRRETFDEIGAFLQPWLDLPKRWSDGFFTGSQIGTTPPRNAGRHRPAGKAIFAVLYGPLCAHIPCHQKWNLFLDGDNCHPAVAFLKFSALRAYVLGNCSLR